MGYLYDVGLLYTFAKLFESTELINYTAEWRILDCGSKLKTYRHLTRTNIPIYSFLELIRKSVVMKLHLSYVLVRADRLVFIQISVRAHAGIQGVQI
jgi:hypothetical protein